MNNDEELNEETKEPITKIFRNVVITLKSIKHSVLNPNYYVRYLYSRFTCYEEIYYDIYKNRIRSTILISLPVITVSTGLKIPTFHRKY